MKWLQRLKSAPTLDANATKPTEPCFVGFVACLMGLLKNSQPRSNHQPTKPFQTPDRWCWPHSSAMSTAEIDAFTVRLARFTDKAVPGRRRSAADKLVTRDRDNDSRPTML